MPHTVPRLSHYFRSSAHIAGTSVASILFSASAPWRSSIFAGGAQREEQDEFEKYYVEIQTADLNGHVR